MKYSKNNGFLITNLGSILLAKDLNKFESVKRKTNTPQDVYDAVTWSAITPLSESSIELGGETVEFPDFTKGQWMYRKNNFAIDDSY